MRRGSWVKDARPALEPDRPLDDVRVLCPWVLPLTTGYRLFYMGHGRASPTRAAGRILSAWSEDGVVWTKEPGVRVDNDDGAEGRALSPCVAATPGEDGYRMYFEASQLPDGGSSVILSARSSDGYYFEREPGVRLRILGARVGSPRALVLEDGRLRLYFHRYPEPFESGLHRGNHVMSAVSRDGLAFEVEPGVRIAQTVHPREDRAVYCATVVPLGGARVCAYYGAWSSGPGRGRGAIMAACSDDGGLSFAKEVDPAIAPDGVFDALFASEPCVFEDRRGRQRMLYEASDLDGKTRIVAAVRVE